MTKTEHYEGFKNDLKQIIEYRTSSRMKRALVQLYHQAKLTSKKEGKSKPAQKYTNNDFIKEMGKVRTQIMKDEFKIIFTEIDRYEKKQKEDMLTTYGKARDGKDTSLWKLIKWDKRWLFIDWVRSRILEKENQDDRLFFSRLSDAVKKNTRFSLQSKSKSRRNKKILDLIKKMTTAFPLREQYKNEIEFWKDIHRILDGHGEFKTDKDILPLSDQNYFMKWLKRHRLKD